MEKKIVVPEGMLKAVEFCMADSMHPAVIIPVLEAALRWLSENPQRPTDRQFGEMIQACRDSIGVKAWEEGTEWMRAGMLCHEWQCHMFFATELPECPECHYIQKEGVAVGHAAWCSRKVEQS